MPSPFDRLPSELLSYIFTTLNQTYLFTRSVSDDSYDLIHYPPLLSSVCVYWRLVAINTPSLWSDLDLGIAELSSRNLAYLNLCYERSGSAPLAVRIGGYGRVCTLRTVDKRLASLLRSYATRLDSITVCYFYKNFLKEILAILLAQGVTGRVRKLAFYADFERGSIVADTSIPQEGLEELLIPLHALCLDGVSFDWNLASCVNLVDLQLIYLASEGTPSSLQLLRFLNANPTIRKLKLSKFNLPSYELNLAPIKLPELQSLQLEVPTQFMSWFFALLAPESHELSLCLGSESKEHPVELVQTLCQFFRQARIVSLQIQEYGWLHLADVIAYLPHLETLKIYHPGYSYQGPRDPYTQNGPLLKLHTVALATCTARHVESALRDILRLPSVKHIIFWQFFSNWEDSSGMNIDQVRELMCGLGITANVSQSDWPFPYSHPSPFLYY